MVHVLIDDIIIHLYVCSWRTIATNWTHNWKTSFAMQMAFFEDMDYVTSQPQGHWDRSGCNSRSKWRREACVGEASQPTEH